MPILSWSILIFFLAMGAFYKVSFDRTLHNRKGKEKDHACQAADAAVFHPSELQIGSSSLGGWAKFPFRFHA
jgi:hypothetical protein